MLRFLRIGLVAAFILLAAHPAFAQETTAEAAAAAYLIPEARGLVALADTLVGFRTEIRPSGRFDLDERILRAEYNVQTRVSSQLAPDVAAFAYINEASDRLGIRRPLTDLTVKEVRRGRRTSHITLQQVYRGVPVYNREVKVNLDADGQPTMVLNGFAPHVANGPPLDTTPTVTGEQAGAIIERAGRVGGLEVAPPHLVIYPSEPPRLAWVARAAPASAAVEWEVLVDARTGEIIQMIDLSLHAARPAPAALFEAGGRNDASGRLVTSVTSATDADSAPPRPYAGEALRPVETVRPAAMVDGTGLVFDPDPITSAGVPYGPPYIDANDADIAELNAERKLVTLRDISQGTDGLYRLEGPYARIDGTCGAVTGYEEPAEPSPDGFQYTRANDYFEAVNAYYHVDKSQRYVQSLDVGFAIKDEPVRVNPHGFGDREDSQFSNNCIMFGTGGIDDAEDADVIWHEYAHALLDFTAPGILVGGEGRALHEGWADYWAASYSRFLSEEDPNIPPHDWQRVFSWDGNVPCWPGRPLDHPGHYPDAVEYPTSGCVSYPSNYAKGMLWGTTLMEIYTDLGREVVDRLNLASHIYIATGVTFADAAQAIIQADEDLYGGAHSNVLIDRFAARGYVDPAEFGPILSHDPLAATEDLGGAVPIEASVIGTSAPVESVRVYYGVDDSPMDYIELDPAGGDTYAGSLPLPSEAGELQYYVEALDTEGRRRRLPAGAPLDTYRFVVGPDAVPPTIAHEAPLNVSVVGWPIDLYAEVRDNIGVDSVWVEYVIEDADGTAQEEGAFGLADLGEAYFGTFPATAHDVQEGESITYRIVARDASRAGNIAASPEEGHHNVTVTGQGVLRAYDFEGLGLGVQATGEWQRGRPEFGLRVAHSGEHVWATGPTAAYSETPQLSTLQLPPLDLTAIGSTYLIFWHWYDFEHTGEVPPGEFSSNADLFDAGNVKVSTDGGVTWSVVEPEGGYNGTISAEHANPLGGEPGFGGYSYGWRREIVPLPADADVRIRFDFATDAGNVNQALYFAGWHIDDVVITTSYPADTTPPVATALPDDRMIFSPGQEATPEVSVVAHDDTGIESLISEYEIKRDDHVETGSVRLAMSTTDRDIFAGVVVQPQSFAAGDRIEYRLVVRDFDGNETVYPSSDSPFVVDYRSLQQRNALTHAVSTGTWQVQGSTWVTGAGEVPGESVSSLVLEPFLPPANGESSVLILEHSFDLFGPQGANVKISADDGSSWVLLEPEGGYPGVFDVPAPHAMSGEGVFAGSSDGTAIHTFDLTAHAGETVRLRLDFASLDEVEPGSGWSVQSASYRSLSPDEEFTAPYELELQANFPDPFADRTTITYSVPDRSAVRISIYDMLGRRVALLRHVEQEAGIYSLQFDGSGLAVGVYMIYLETPSGTRTERMVVAR